MKKSSKKSRTGRTWKVAILDDDDVWAEPKLNEKIIHEQNRNDILDAVAYCYADAMLTYYLYRQVRLKKLKRKLIISAAMLGVSATSLVIALSIFFGWWT